MKTFFIPLRPLFSREKMRGNHVFNNKKEIESETTSREEKKKFQPSEDVLPYPQCSIGL